MTSRYQARGRAVPSVFAAALVALTLVAGACSSGDDPTEATEPDETPTTAVEEAATDSEEGESASEHETPEATEAESDHDDDTGAPHTHDEALEVTWEPVPSVTLEVVADAKAGWNVHAVPSDFVLAPEHASTDAVDGEGHMHIYVDGEKITRVYGEWFYLPALGHGSHEIRVELSANNHSALAIDGVLIDATVTVEEGDVEPADDDDAAPPEVEPVVIDVVGGEVSGGGRLPLALGSDVVLLVTSDTADHVHVHGYDVLVELAANEPTEVAFTADLPGVWEVELEDAGLLLAELEVS